MGQEQNAHSLIIKSVRGLYTVVSPDGVSGEFPARGILRKRGQEPYVGDHVRIEDGAVAEVLPRKNEIIRPPLANLDQLCFVVSMCEPQPNLRLLDKFIAVSAYKDITPLLLLTKLDLASSEQICRLYSKIGIPILPVDYSDPATLDAVRAAFRGKVSALTGNSGAGKSTLLNALDDSLCIPTGEISRKLGRGRHTTRHAQLYPLKEGGYIADTPGFSTFDTMRYAVIRKHELADCFIEFAPYTSDCRFQDCSHTCEKGCAVIEAVQSGAIPKSRHESYCEMYEEAKQIKEWELEKS
ncbi:MAG: ribosome small subunit-dependent GTPase A [Oscillospiraceae bacterium]|nr:ribosome small subunit-dependent GTPase A [Oscillospiraceae bacterium]